MNDNSLPHRASGINRIVRVWGGLERVVVTRNPTRVKRRAFGRMGFIATSINWHPHKQYESSL